MSVQKIEIDVELLLSIYWHLQSSPQISTQMTADKVKSLIIEAIGEEPVNEQVPKLQEQEMPTRNNGAT